MMFNKGNCKVLPVEKNNPMHQYRLEAGQLDISFAEKDPGEPDGPTVVHDPAVNSEGKEEVSHGSHSTVWHSPGEVRKDFVEFASGG
ncbi:hypothetical protein BTVI_30636 [Pitangus sulphuratus]|nr:hypothetical protein BTVI_30636 [Pitangus sulphuratus]